MPFLMTPAVPTSTRSGGAVVGGSPVPGTMKTEVAVIGPPAENLVPVSMTMGVKIGQGGVYSTIEFSVHTTSLHPAGNLEARHAAATADRMWALAFFEESSGKLNELRHSIGQNGQWNPPSP